jgi:hypothetical protein
MKKLFALLIFLISFQSLFAQVDYVKKFIKRMYFDKDSSKKSNFVLIPALASSPETGIEFGGASLYSFYTDTTPHNITRVSNLYGYASITTKGQEKVSLNASYWKPQNTLHYTGFIGFVNFPFDFYGIGNDTRKADVEAIEEKRTKISVAAEKLVIKDFYAGLAVGGFKYYYYSGTYNENIEFKTDPTIEDRSGGSSVYVGPSLTYDSRNNNTYTTKGTIINAYINLMQGVYSNKSYEGGFFNIEYSQFFALSKHFVLGLDIQEQSLIGGRSPFYLLPALGSDEMMRGYYTGRYRDRNYIAGQTELRYRINDRFGMVAFLGTGEVAHNGFTAHTLLPNYGGGLRYFFDTEKGLSIRADYGLGAKPTGEKRESGFYIALGESF